ncbi:MAG: gliding motility lipoprotein GldD [Flavobacteriaceae bacterium]|jgi:gliding motility-associated lipoprotein GldD
MKHALLLLVLFCIFSCEEERQPLPKAYLKLQYPEASYKAYASQQAFEFEHNRFAEVIEDERGLKLIYPSMKATVYLNYKPVEKNLPELLNDAYQLPYKHVVKATAIPEKLFINTKDHVYGTLFMVEGNAASQFQFFATDSLQHFVIGSLYFYAQPNYDSLYPAIQYLQKDIAHFLESLRWN